MDILKDKTILLGITGGISAYKAPDIASKLRQLGANVDVVMTESAAKIITPRTLQSITSNGSFGYVAGGNFRAGIYRWLSQPM